MDKLRLSDLRVPIAEALNVCAASDEVVTMVNRVERRLMRIKGGKWVGCVARMRVCVYSGCLVWPRQIETIEGYQICGTPGTVRNSWYEWNIQGPGALAADSGCYNDLIDRGTLPTFDTPSDALSKVAVTADVAEAVGARILIRGYDQNSAWIRTQDAGVWIDGEYVAVEGGVTHYSTHVFSAITGVIKPSTNGPVRLYQSDATTGAIIKALAYYEPTEEVPIYRASLIPGLSLRNGCGPTQTCCCTDTNATQVTVIAKLRHIDVRDDTDFLVLGNEAAFALGAQALLKERRNLWEEAQKYWASAERELQNELSSYEGDAAIPTFKQEGRQSWGAGVNGVIAVGWPLSY